MTAQHPDWDELWEQVQNGRDEKWLRDYIKSHYINQCTDEQGNTLLHRAVQYNENDVICRLSHLFIDPNIKNAAGQTALQLARDIKSRGLGTLHHYHLCIDFAKASTKPNGLDALFAAIYRGDATLGDTSGVTDDGNERNAGRWTALHCAVMYDRPHLIRELHQRFLKLDANCLTSFTYSALRLAAKHGHSNCIIALCECFPAIKAGDVLHVACQFNHPACIPTLRKYFPQLTGNELTNSYKHSSALMYAVLHNNPECIRALHSCFPDIDPNRQDKCGNTALIAAAQHPGSPDCIPMLSECFPDIDPNKEDNYGNAALMHACEQRLPQSITSLATFFPNTDVNMCNEEGKTALMLAIECNDEKCIVTLCESFPNIDLTIQNRYGDTALLLAIRHSNPEPIISQLHKFFPNIDPNAQNQSGQTALMLAANHSHPEPIISQLRTLFPNLDPNTQDEDKDTVLMYLLQSPGCTVEYVRHFLDTFPNVDVNLQNDRGETALTLAIEQGNAPVVDLLLKRFPDIIYHTTSAGQTTLMLEIENNRIDSISILLKHIAQMQ